MRKILGTVLVCGAATIANAQSPDLCSVISPADVEAVIKGRVMSAQPLKYTKGCRYATASAGGNVTINFLNTGGDAKEEFAGQKRMQALGGKVQDIAGVGDEAVFNLVLVARKGERVVMIEPQALPEAQRREQAVALARVALAKGF